MTALRNWLARKIKPEPAAIANNPIDLDRLGHMLEYAKMRNLAGKGASDAPREWIGNFIWLETEYRSFVHRADTHHHTAGTVNHVYPSICWSFMPDHLGIYLVDGVIELRASHDGIGPRETMPLAQAPEDIHEIGRCFDFWYEKFGLPASLAQPVHAPRTFEPSGDAMTDIITYLQNPTVDAFFDLFEDDGPVMWVDWGEEDDNIVHMAANVLALDQLSARFDDGLNDDLELVVNYDGTEHRIRYPEKGAADRDTTLFGLNQILLPKFELRLCTAARGSDMGAFLALPASDWDDLERAYPEAVGQCFEDFSRCDTIFGSRFSANNF